MISKLLSVVMFANYMPAAFAVVLSRAFQFKMIRARDIETHPVRHKTDKVRQVGRFALRFHHSFLAFLFANIQKSAVTAKQNPTKMCRKTHYIVTENAPKCNYMRIAMQILTQLSKYSSLPQPLVKRDFRTSETKKARKIAQKTNVCADLWKTIANFAD